MRDDDVRSSCFASLDVLCARYGEDVPYPGGLDQGFPFRGGRVPFLSTQKGIFRAARQSGPAALSIQTSWKSPYGDSETPTGYRYAYRAGPIDQPDNRALRAAYTLGVPIVHFVSTRPNYYKPLYPCFVVEDDPAMRLVLVSPGRMAGPLDEQEPVLLEDPIERRYVFRETRVRVHQARFRARVVPGPGRYLARLRGTRRDAAARGGGRPDARTAQGVPQGTHRRPRTARLEAGPRAPRHEVRAVRQPRVERVRPSPPPGGRPRRPGRHKLRAWIRRSAAPRALRR